MVELLNRLVHRTAAYTGKYILNTLLSSMGHYAFSSVCTEKNDSNRILFNQTLDIFFISKDLLISHTKHVLSPVIEMLK